MAIPPALHEPRMLALAPALPGKTGMRAALRARCKDLAVYAAALALCLGILIWSMKLYQADLRVPLFYHLDDSLFPQTLVKGVLENGWYLHNPAVGAPLGLDMRHFPMADSLHFFLIKLLGLVTRDAALAANLYYLSTFPLAALTALWVLRRLRCSRGPALVGSLLFTFLPYHLMRGGHIFLAAYYLVPCSVLVTLWIFHERVPFFRSKADSKPAGLDLLAARTVGAVLVAILLGCGGVYYALLSCYLLIMAGAIAAFHRRRFYPLGSAGLVIAVIGASLLANFWPTVLLYWREGVNSAAVFRIPYQTETFALKISQLLLPIDHHRLRFLADLKADYNGPFTPLINENRSSSLGLIGALGFLFLIGRLFTRRSEAFRRQELDALCMLNLAALLLATMGGFGSLIGYTITSWIRAYNRISIFIGFFSLAAVMLLLEQLYRKVVHSRKAAACFLSALGALLLLGIFDQTSEEFVPPYARVSEQYRDEAAFIRRIEACVPEHAMIYQLPYARCPEKPPVHLMTGYDPLRAYLHSRTLRWSHGAVDGSEADAWQQQIESLPLAEKIETLCCAGFAGIYLDRNGYADGGAEVESRLTRLLGAPMVHDGGRWIFYTLAEYAERLQRECSEEMWQARRDTALNSVRATWRRGFQMPAAAAVDLGRWCAARGELHLINRSTRARVVHLEMAFAAALPQPFHLQMHGLFSEQLQIDNVAMPFARTVTVPPGEHIVTFQCDAPRLRVPGLFMNLVFVVKDFKMREEGLKESSTSFTRRNGRIIDADPHQ